jgi:cell division transport system ATP-binding protein
MFHVTKQYTRDARALEDVSLLVDKGEFVFLEGPSGAGKTTLLKLLFCAEPPSDGQILIGDRNVSRMRASGVPFLRRNIGVVFQDFKLLPNRTVFENVALALEVLGRRPADIRRRVTTVLGQVGLGHKLHALPQRLSGGEQQRVAIARALVNEPAILLADEPTGNLDPELALDVMGLINTANTRGTTVLVATHDPTLMAAFPKRRVRLERGRVVHDTR